jgi:TPR repeat protein
MIDHNINDPNLHYSQGYLAYTFHRDSTTAKTRLTFAAKRSHARAQRLLGSIYEEEGQYRQAARWYRLSAW